jgi:hypothetical protein
MDSDPRGNNGALEGPSSIPHCAWWREVALAPQYALREDQHPAGRWRGSAEGLHFQPGEGREGTAGAAAWLGLDWSVLLTAKVEVPRFLHPLSGSVGCVTAGARCHPGRLTESLARSCLAVLRDPQGVL